MDAYTCILTKRDSRAYTDQAIPEATLERVLRAGRMAGSAKNTQPWSFIVLRDATGKAELAACGQFAQHLPAAPVLVAVVLAPNGGDFDAGRAAQNMMLVAWEEGITSCPVAMHDRECASRALGVPEGHRVAMVLAFGYPESEESLHRGIPRTPLAELVHHERW
ncbi:MAG: nitroreductase family protein [Chloroflexi bacterium]|nr:nitroreductase family protein [Chloroflexota bacterium]